MNINDYKDTNGNVEVSETLVGDIIDEINLGNVLDGQQPVIIHRSANNQANYINLPNTNKSYLLISAWTSAGAGMWIITARGGGIYISEVKGDSAVAISSSGLQLIVNKTTYRFITLIDIY